MKITEANVTAVSAVLHTGLSALAALVFFAVAFAAGYDWVARIGGAGWVFVLAMVILMPTVPALLRGRIASPDQQPD